MTTQTITTWFALNPLSLLILDGRQTSLDVVLEEVRRFLQEGIYIGIWVFLFKLMQVSEAIFRVFLRSDLLEYLGEQIMCRFRQSFGLRSNLKD